MKLIKIIEGLILEDYNDKVAEIQKILKADKLDLGKFGPNGDGVDGVLGEKTKRAIFDYKLKHNKDLMDMIKDDKSTPIKSNDKSYDNYTIKRYGKGYNTQVIMIEPTNPISSKIAIIYAGMRSRGGGADNVYSQIPESLKSQKRICITPEPGNPGYKSLSSLKTLLGITDNDISSLSGFSKGGEEIWQYFGKYSFTGLLDPSLSMSTASHFNGTSDAVLIMSNLGYWCSGLKTAEKILGTNKTKKPGIGHLEVPSYFFKNYSNKL